MSHLLQQHPTLHTCSSWRLRLHKSLGFNFLVRIRGEHSKNRTSPAALLVDCPRLPNQRAALGFAAERLGEADTKDSLGSHRAAERITKGSQLLPILLTDENTTAYHLSTSANS